MLEALERGSDALAQASRDGRLDGCLTPAMVGCADCGTASVITAPVPPGTCPECGRALGLVASAARPVPAPW